MNEKFNKNAKVEQLTKVVLSHGEEKDLIVKDPFILRTSDALLHTLSKLYDVPVGFVSPFLYATGTACQQRTLTPPDTWSCPTSGLACVLMSRPISPELVLSPDLWISNTPRYFSFALEAVYCYICSHRRVAVARYWIICLVVIFNKYVISM